MIQTPSAAGSFLARWLAALASVLVGPMPTLTGMPVHCLTVRRMSAARSASRSVGDAGQIQERLVDRVDFDLGGELLQRLHDAAAHVAVERVIAGKDGDAVPLDQVADLEIRIAHLEAEGLGLVAAGDDAAVVVGEHDHRPVDDRRVEDPLARRIEIIAIDQGEHGAGQYCRTLPVTRPQISKSLPSVISMGG